MGVFGGNPFGEVPWGSPGGSPTPPPPTTGIPGAPGTTPGQYNNPTPLWNTGATNNDVPPGSTSSVAGFVPDILMIIQEACEQAGVDFTSPYTIRTAKRSIDLLQMEFANEGLNLWTLDFQQLPLVAGTYQYILPADTVDLIIPMIRTINQGIQTDLLIVKQDFADYAAIPNKLQQARPTTAFVLRSTIPVVTLWPVPDGFQQYILGYWRLRRMQNTGYPTNLLDMPFRFVPALISGLAWQMKLKSPGQKDLNTLTYLEGLYRRKMELAKYEDRDKSPMYLTPDLGYNGGW